MEMHIEAAKAFKELLDHYKKGRPDYMQLAANAIGRTRQTVKQYAASPEAKGFRKPPLEAIERLREEIMIRDVYPLFVTIGGPVEIVTETGVASFTDYAVAADFAEVRNLQVLIIRDQDIRPYTKEELLRHQWRQIAFRAIVSKSVLAEIAGTDIYHVGWVGREHPTLGVQPTFEMVAKATAAEALTTSGRIAA